MEIGKVYKINHSRKGSFVGRVIEHDEEWCTIELTEGEARFISRGIDNATEGERVTLRKSFMDWTLV